MDYFWYFYIILIGCIAGSFLNICIDRIPAHKSIVSGASDCPNCKHTYKLQHMVPLFSYMFQRGRCPYCKCRLSIQSFVLEILTASLFLLTCFSYGFTIQSLLLCIFFCVLIVAGGIDYHTLLIPDCIHIWILILAAAQIILAPYRWAEHLIGFFILSIPMLLSTLFIDGFGGGDIKLCAVCGFFLGFQSALFGFAIACILASLISLMMILKKKVTKKSAVCFGPYLAIGFIISALWGSRIIGLYLNLLNYY